MTERDKEAGGEVKLATMAGAPVPGKAVFRGECRTRIKRGAAPLAVTPTVSLGATRVTGEWKWFQ